MKNRLFLKQFAQFSLALVLLSTGLVSQAAVSDGYSKQVKSCLKQGWKHLSVKVGGIERAVLWKRPRGRWKQGSIVVMHGGGGSHHQFCTGSDALEPQIEFAEEAVEEGFGVFLLDSTNDVVSDEKGRLCGKRFDFAVTNRRNVDLPFIGKMIKKVIPQLRPGRSSKNVFLTGFSSGGYMATRAATHFNSRVAAFAPVSAGDPYGTLANCDVNLSNQKKVKGLFIDAETNKAVTAKQACSSRNYPNEKAWPTTRSRTKPSFKQFHNQGDAIVDLSCMKKSQILLRQHGYRDDGAVIIKSRKRRISNHLWLDDYNDEMIEFFKSTNKK